MAAIVNARGPHLGLRRHTSEKSSPAGLYRPEFEHDACGVAFVADLSRPAQPCHGRDGLGQPVPPGAPGRQGS